jgi:hypothetical protein
MLSRAFLLTSLDILFGGSGPKGGMNLVEGLIPAINMPVKTWCKIISSPSIST